MNLRAGADANQKLTERYNVTYIDTSRLRRRWGRGVYENVALLTVREFVYNPAIKTPW